MRTFAFTLIEMMIAVTLGMLIVYTAVAGFRVASQATTLASRLSLENSLIRAGMTEAHQQLDFWTNLDDPNDTTRQRLRRSVNLNGDRWASTYSHLPGTTKVGFPFAAMRDVFPANRDIRTAGVAAGSMVPRRIAAPGFARAEISAPPSPVPIEMEQDVGFDPTYTWAAHDPRTWFRANCLEKDRWTAGPSWLPQQKFGRYGIFSNIDANPVFRTFGALKTQESDTSTYSASYQAQPAHLWYGRQLAGLARALGFYGFCEYLPSNALYQAHSSYDGARTSSGGLNFFFRPHGRASGGFIGEGMTNTGTQGIYSLTAAQSYGITDPYDRTVSDTQLMGEFCRYWKTDYPAASGAGRAELQQFVQVAVPLKELMKSNSRPGHWPVVSVATGRYVKSGHFVNIAKIRWTSPMTGEMAELSFTSLCTSLRGARMQRKIGGDWANWDNATNATNDDHLDTP